MESGVPLLSQQNINIIAASFNSKQSESAKSVSISTNVTIKPHCGANIDITSAYENVTTQLVSSYSADSNPGNGGLS